MSFIRWRVCRCESSHKSHAISSTSRISTLFGVAFWRLCPVDAVNDDDDGIFVTAWLSLADTAATLTLEPPSMPSLFSLIWPFVKRHSHSNEQLHTNGLLAKRSRCKRSNGKWAASSVCKSFPRIEISIKFGLPWNSFSGRSANDGFSSSVIICRNVLSTKALEWKRKKNNELVMVWVRMRRYVKVPI